MISNIKEVCDKDQGNSKVVKLLILLFLKSRIIFHIFFSCNLFIYNIIYIADKFF